jgi:hypothetical protein
LGLYCLTSLTRQHLIRVFCSALPPTCRGTTASADFCQFNRTSLNGLSLWKIHPSCRRLSGRPPRVRTITFIPSTRCIYCLGFGQYRTSFCVANSSAPGQPFMQFLFIEPGLCLQLLSDPASRRTPLPSANSSCCQAYSGLSPPSYHSCRAHSSWGRWRKPMPPFSCLSDERVAARAEVSESPDAA